MAWVRKFFKKKQKVWTLVDDETGELVVEGGFAQIRYQNTDEAKVYTVHWRNIGGDASSPGGGRPARSPLAEALAEAPAPAAPTAPAPTANSAADRARAAASAARSAAFATSTPTDTTPRRPNTETQPSLFNAAPASDGGTLWVNTEVPDSLIDQPWPAGDVIEVYTDGACSGNPGPCSLGVLIRSDAGYREVRQYLGRGTNNIGELTAIKVALEQIPEADRRRPVRLHTDSSYSIGVLTKNWKAKANRELIQSIKDLMRQFPDLDLIKVKGHSGHPLNERADWLAVSAIEHR